MQHVLFMCNYCGINEVPMVFQRKKRKSVSNILRHQPSGCITGCNLLTVVFPNDAGYKESTGALGNKLLIRGTGNDKVAVYMNEQDARVFLTNFSNSQAENSTTAWRKLGEYLLVKYMDGNMKKEENGKFLQNEFHIPPTIIRHGYPEEVLR
jgi:hypothetical protein